MRRDKFVFLGPLVIGSILLVGSYFFPTATTNGAWWRNIMASGAAVFIGVTISEFFLKLVPKIVKERDQIAFEEFFGITYSNQQGHIILQADRIDQIVSDLSPHPEAIEALINEPNPQPGAKAGFNRLFKARRWVNAHDADASRAIREAFRNMERPPPELYVEGHDKRKLHEAAPFVISTGLGFTENTDEVFRKACEGWMKYYSATECGDVVALHQKIYPGNSPDFHPPGQCVDGEYLKLLPRSWNRDSYLAVPDELQEGLTGREKPPSTVAPDDYAIILRHTEDRGNEPSQLRFVVAGFTAHATAAAGKYLADHWFDLWESYVKGQLHSGDGDFCQLIVGNSEFPGSWRAAENVVQMTSKHLATVAKLDCVWKFRFDEKHRNSPSKDRDETSSSGCGRHRG